MGDLVEPPPPTMFTQAPVRDDDEPEEENGLRSGSSAKIDQLVHLLKLTPDTEKSLVFSQFTSFLDKVCACSDLLIRVFDYGTDCRDSGKGRVRFCMVSPLLS